MIVRSLPDSVTLDELVENDHVGALSLSVMVFVTDCDPSSEAPPPSTPEIAMTLVSLPTSYNVSSVGLKAVVPVVPPAEIVISDTVAKSVPSVAVPPVPSIVTVISS